MKGLSPILITDAVEIDLFECLKYDQMRNNGILHTYLPQPYEGYVDVQLCWTRVRYGRRIWFQAPCCQKRTSKLYIYGNRLACRQCLDLKYPSQYRKDAFSRSMMTQRKLQRLQKRRLWHGDSLTRFGFQYRKLMDERDRQTVEMISQSL
jgi:hypothetical protein